MKKVILLMLLAGLFVGCKGEVDNGEPGIINGTPVTLNLKLQTIRFPLLMNME